MGFISLSPYKCPYATLTRWTDQPLAPWEQVASEEPQQDNSWTANLFL